MPRATRQYSPWTTFFTALIALGLCVGAAQAAGLKAGADAAKGSVSPTGTMTAASRLAVDENYRLNSGDVLQIQVYAEPTLTGVFPIGPAGSIAYPMLGQITLRGLTLGEAQRLMTAKIGTIVRLPQVVITLNELASVRKVYLSGEFTRTGAVTLPFGATLTDALAVVGPGPYADLRRVRLTHPGASPIEVDCSGLRGDGPLGSQHRLEYGDTIYLPRVREEVSIFGEVRNPGTLLLPVGQDLTVLDALRVAGGFTALADRSRALLIRAGAEPQTINLDALLAQGNTAENRKLEGGDVLVVPQTGGIAVVGQVRQPWVFPAGSSVPILQALTQAGGPLPTGDLNRAQIVRGGKTITVDLQKFMDDGTAPAEMALQPGDVLLIPKGEGQNVLLVGALSRSGTVSLRGLDQRDLLRIVTMAGPVAGTDLTRVTVYRGNETIVRDLKALMEKGDLTQNLELQAGDLVMVPAVEVHSVLLTGMLGRQGVVQIARAEDHDLLRVVTLAGAGAMSDLSRVTVYRGGQTIVKNIKSAIEQGTLAESVPLQDGDVVYVPPIEQSVVLTGALQRTGIVRLMGEEQRNLAKLILLSGPLGAADLSKVTVTRGAEKIVVNVRKYLDEGDQTQTLELQDNDMVRVPAVEESILLTGALARSGVLRLYDGLDRDLVSLILAAGPLPNADLENVTVYRADKKTVRNLKAMVEQGDRTQSMLLEAGDIVSVPPKQLHYILMTGAVGRPGLVTLVEKEQRDLARLVTVSGPLPNADLTKVAVRRGGLTTTRDLKAYLDNGLPQNTLELEDGDVVVVPRGEATVLVMGSVARSGTLQLMDDKQKDLLHVVVLAGPTALADLAHVTVYRGDQVIVRDLQRLYDTGDTAQTLQLQDGDIIKVPAYEQRVLIAGAATHVGEAALGPQETRDLARMVQLAMPSEFANLHKVKIVRGSQTFERDVWAYLQRGDRSQTMSLEDGDVVLIPLDQDTATITGAVARAGSLKIDDPAEMDLVLVVNGAGPLPTADLRRVTIYRDDKALVYDLSAIRSGGENLPKEQVQRGDRVFVPGLDATTVLLSGAVQRIGAAELVTPEQRDLAKFVMTAGPLTNADLSRVMVFRGSTIASYDVKAYLEKGDVSQTTELNEGDRVLVPDLGANAIQVTGKVLRQGPMPVTVGLTPDLLNVVTLAQPDINLADLGHVTVYRKGQTFVRDLDRLREQGDLSQNMTLEPGDLVYVPENTDTVIFSGQVARIGAINIHTLRQKDLAHVVPLAQPTEAADLERLTIYREGEKLERNYRALVEKGDVAQNMGLQAGDIVFVPRDDAHDVMVLGALNRVGPINVREEGNRDLLKIIMALGPTPIADMSRVTVFRADHEPMYRNLKLLVDEGDLSQNMQVQVGDVVVVPKMEDMFILGAVVRPGAYPAQPDWTTMDAITAAGGVAPGGQLQMILIRRRPDGTSEHTNISMAVMVQGKSPEIAKVKPGDILYVPYARAKRGFSWDLIREGLFYLGTLNDIFGVFD
jgi:polysaccharide export outer membrane protein